MRYRITKETKPKLPTYGKYKAKAVHNQIIESHQLYEEAARGTVLSAGVLEGLMMNVADAVWRHLRMGDKVRLKNFGLLKLEIESDKVENLKDFRAKKHIRGVRLHFIPESEHGSPELYKDITFEKDKNSILGAKEIGHEERDRGDKSLIFFERGRKAGVRTASVFSSDWGRIKRPFHNL